MHLSSVFIFSSVYKKCGKDEFTCQYKDSSHCIKSSQRCDGKFDCHDRSDEADCLPINTTACHYPDHFLCDNGVCINYTLVCNGRNDCRDDSDEPSICGINECISKKWPVCGSRGVARCVDRKIGYECQCKPGYQVQGEDLSGRGPSERNNAWSYRKMCVDINECDTSLPCSQHCINTMGSFKCSCEPGFKLFDDGRTCLVTDNIAPQLLVSNRYYILLINTSQHSNNIVKVTSQASNAVAVDFDWGGQYIYWSDIAREKSSINRMSYNFTDHTAGVSGSRNPPILLSNMS